MQAMLSGMRRLVMACPVAAIFLTAAPRAMAGSAEDIRYYEMYLPPNADGRNNPASSWGGVYQPAVLYGDGFGNDDYDSATMGLRHNGTARCVDSGAHGLDGFWIRMPRNDVADMEIMAHINCQPSGTGGATYTGHTFEVLANDDYGLCIALDTDKIRLVDKVTGTYAQAAIDLTTWKKLRFAMSDRAPTGGEDLPPGGGGTAATTYVKIYTDNGSGWVSLIDWSQVKSDSLVPLDNTVRNDGNNAPKFVIHCSNAATTNSDFSAKYFRVSGGGDYGNGFVVGYGGTRAMKTPQENAVFDDACELTADPLGTYSRTVDYGTSRAVYYLLANTSNTTGVASHWTVTEVDAGGNPTTYDWVSTVPTGGTVTSNQTQNDPAGSAVSQYVTVTLNGNGTLPDGPHTAYLKFADDCPATALMRRIDYTVDGCKWSVSPTSRIESTPELPGNTTRDHVLTIKNEGTAGWNSFTYTATECNGAKGPQDMPWMELIYGGGPIAPGGSETVTVRIDFTRLAAGDNEGHVLLTNTCNPSDQLFIKVLPPFIVEYKGDVDPTTGSAAGAGMQWVAFNMAYPEEVQEGVEGSAQGIYGAIDDKCWKMSDSPRAKKEYHSDRTVNIDGDGPYAVGATVVARVKCTFHSGTPHTNLGIRDDSGLNSGFHWSGAGDPPGTAPGHVLETIRGSGNETWIEGQTPEWYADWHILRLTAEGNGGSTSRVITLYVDEDRAWKVQINNALESNAGDPHDALSFGASSGAGMGTATVYYDWITGTNAGAFAPGEEEALLGRSLCLGPDCYVNPCNTLVFADVDEDADVDQDDFGAFQRCYTGDGGAIPVDPAYCECFDRREEGGQPGSDGQIDAFDYDAFEDCASGPGVTADPACDD